MGSNFRNQKMINSRKRRIEMNKMNTKAKEAVNNMSKNAHGLQALIVAAALAINYSVDTNYLTPTIKKKKST